MLIKTDTGEVEINLDDHTEEIQSHYQGKGILFKTQAEIDAEKESVKTETSNRVSKEVHEAWETKASEILGEKKKDGVKGIDWFAETVKPIVEKAKAPAPTPTSTQSSSVADDVIKAALKQTQDELKALRDAQESEKKAEADKALNVGIKSATRALNLAGETDQEKAETRNQVEILAKSMFTWKHDEEGDLVAYKGDQIQTDPATGKAMTFNKIVETHFKHLIVPAKKEDPRPTIIGTNTKPAEVVITSDGRKAVKAGSMDEVRQKARELGYLAGSKESREFAEASAKLSGLDPNK